MFYANDVSGVNVLSFTGACMSFYWHYFHFVFEIITTGYLQIRLLSVFWLSMYWTSFQKILSYRPITCNGTYTEIGNKNRVIIYKESGDPWGTASQRNVVQINTHWTVKNGKLFFTFMWPCIVINFFVIKPNRCTNFTNLFWHEYVHVSDSYSVHHQEFIHCTLSSGMCRTGL